MTEQPTGQSFGAAQGKSAPPLFTNIDELAVLSLTRSELDERRIVGFDSRDSRSRPYHLLRTQLTKIMERNNWRMIGVTSATPAAGKTFTSVNLAAALAPTAQAPVVLCDLDLRRGSIGKMLQVEAEQGVSDYLEGKVDDAETLPLRINETQLAIVPTMTSRSSSSQLIASPRFRDLMERLRMMSNDSIIICDLPPVFANDDAMLCMQYLDAYLLVVDHGMSTSRQLEEAIRLLNPIPCLGTVLNRYQGGFADPYGYGYGDPYGMKTYG